MMTDDAMNDAMNGHAQDDEIEKAIAGRNLGATMAAMRGLLESTSDVWTKMMTPEAHEVLDRLGAAATHDGTMNVDAVIMMALISQKAMKYRIDTQSSDSDADDAATDGIMGIIVAYAADPRADAAVAGIIRDTIPTELIAPYKPDDFGALFEEQERLRRSGIDPSTLLRDNPMPLFRALATAAPDMDIISAIVVRLLILSGESVIIDENGVVDEDGLATALLLTGARDYAPDYVSSGIVSTLATRARIVKSQSDAAESDDVPVAIHG